jgi:hypothetical protein
MPETTPPSTSQISGQLEPVEGALAAGSRVVLVDLECAGSRPAVADWDRRRLSEIIRWTTLGHRPEKLVLAFLAMDADAYTSDEVVNASFHEAWNELSHYGSLSDPQLSLDIIVHTHPDVPSRYFDCHFGFSREHNPHHEMHLFAADFVGGLDKQPGERGVQRTRALQQLGLQTVFPDGQIDSSNLDHALRIGVISAGPDGPDEVVVLRPPEPYSVLSPLVATAFRLRRE